VVSVRFTIGVYPTALLVKSTRVSTHNDTHGLLLGAAVAVLLTLLIGAAKEGIEQQSLEALAAGTSAGPVRRVIRGDGFGALSERHNGMDDDCEGRKRRREARGQRRTGTGVMCG